MLVYKSSVYLHSSTPFNPFQEPLAIKGVDSIGARIRAARTIQGWTQQGLANAAGIPLSTLKKYEGDQRVPGGEALAGFARAGINVNWLLQGDVGGPATLEGRIRETHADYIAGVAGDEEAAGRSRQRSKEAFQRAESALRTIASAAEAAEYVPSPRWIVVLSELIVCYQVDEYGIRNVLDALALEARIKQRGEDEHIKPT
jgi:transcriptional regulator with XRE-family HTH domain